MTATTITTEHLALDGPIHIVVAVVLTCALLWLFAWSLRREQKVIGKRNVVFFWFLRAAALGIAMWMLLGPSSVRVEETSARRTVVIAVDVSGSMQTVDPVGTSDDLRWLTGTSEESLTTVADRALAAAHLAERRLDKATTSIARQQPEHHALESAASAHDAITRARDGVKTVGDRLNRRRSQTDGTAATELSDQAAKLLQMLDGSEFERLAKLAAHFRGGRDAFATGWRESLTDLQHQLAGIRRRLSNLTSLVAAWDQRTSPPPSPSQTASGDHRESRLVRVARLMDAVKAGLLDPMGDKIDVRFCSFERGLDRLDVPESPSMALNPFLNVADGTGAASVTDLTRSLEELRRDLHELPVAAVFLLTDVGHNGSADRTPAEAAAELQDVPVYVVPVGNPQHIRDVDLKSVYAPNVVMEDDDVVIEATLQAFDCDGESCRVELLRDGAVVQHREIAIDSALATRRVRFDTRIDDVGTQRFQVRVVPLEGELTEDNNFDQFEVNVTRNRIDVLLAEGISRWEYRYLSQLFRRDRKVDCDELLFRPRIKATGRRKESQSFPTTIDEWDQYDVVMLGDVSTEFLPPKTQTALVSFLRDRGGTLVMIAGEEFMPHAYVNQPLEDVLPVTQAENIHPTEGVDGFAFRVTSEGWQHHALMIADTEASTKTAWNFINRNSPMSWLSEYRQARPSARTLISAVPLAGADGQHDERRNSLLCWQPVGSGRIVYLASPESYRLRYLRGDRLHYRFWGQLLRWAVATELAAGSEMVSVRTDRSDYRTSDSVQVVVRLNDEEGNPVTDAKPKAVASGVGDKRVTIPLEPDASSPGRYIGRLDRLETGVYRIEPTGDAVDSLLQPNGDGDATHSRSAASFTVRSDLNRELLDTRCDRALAQQIADASGGQVLPPTAIGEVLNLTDLEPILTETTDSVALWVQWKFLWIVFGCLFTEWAVRKWMGLS